MLKFFFIKEAFIAVLLTMLCAGLISFLDSRYEFFSGIKWNLRGADMYDFFYKEKNKNSLMRDTNIILVQIEDAREAIAKQINIIEAYHPAIIGIDALFENKKDSSGDSKLLQSISSKLNIVFAYKLGTDKEERILQQNFFDASVSKEHSGYIDFNRDKYGVVRTYSPFQNSNGTRNFAFTSRIAQLYSPEKFDQLKHRKNGNEIVNYTGNTERYTGILKEELLEYYQKNQLQELFKNKIILLGYFTKYPPFIPDDLYFSPLNDQTQEKRTPDMYGIVIHANILSMILDGNYTKTASKLTSFLVAFFITFLLLFYMIYLYSENDLPSYPKIILIQLLVILLVLFFLLQVYNIFLWKTPLLPVLISLIICIEILGLYKIIARWLHKKTGYKTAYSK